MLQSPGARGRGIGRYALGWALALEEARPDLVSRYLLDPDLPPPGAAEALLATGKVAYAGTPGTLPPGAAVFHALWPLDPDRALRRLWPDEAHARGLRLSATVYDLIPALDPASELADPVLARRYRARLEILRAADRLLTISAAVSRDCEKVLGSGPTKAVRVGAAPDAAFRPYASEAERAEGAGRLRELQPGLARRYVLFPSGSHPRKNNEALVTAWTLLPPRIRDDVTLVITGEIPPATANHYRHLASLGGAAGAVLVVGHIAEETLLALYRGAELVCFPSLAEGYALPVAEALACGVPVIASDRPPLDELLPEAARFDPTSPAAIAAAIARALDGDLARKLDGELAQELALAGGPHSGTPAATLRWEDVAGASAAALEELAAAGPRARHRPTGRPRVAIVSPLPPAGTGVAAYTYRLMAALQATGSVELHAFADSPLAGPPGRAGSGEAPRQGAPGPAGAGSSGLGAHLFVAPAGIAVHRARSLPAVEAWLGGFHRVVYAIGNSHHHLGALSVLRKRPGLVLAHDVRLTNLYRHEHGDPGIEPGGLGRAIRRLYGDSLPAGLGAGGELSAEEIDRFGLLLAREVVAASEGFLVSSLAAQALARADAGPALASRISVLPFAIAAPGSGAEDFGDEVADADAGPPDAGAGHARRNGPDSATGAAGALDPSSLCDAPVVAHFGIVDPVKAPEVVLRAVALLRDRAPGLRLAFVGPISDALGAHLTALATEVGLGDGLILTGPLTAPAYRHWLERADVAVQLRTTFNGEASAAVGECLACGLPTIVTRMGSLRELPDDAVVKVEPRVTPAELAGLLAGLLGDPARRARLGAEALRAAAGRTFALAAEGLLERLLA